MSCSMTCVSFKLMVSPKSWQASLKRVMSCCRSSAECAVTAASSAKRKSRRHRSWTLVLALSLERLKSFPSVLVRRQIPSAAGPNACFSITAKKIPNKVGARTHPCFAPLRMLKAADVEPSKTTVPFMSSWKDLMMLRSLGGHPILGRILKRPSLLTRSKAIVRSMKAMKSGCLSSLHFSWSCLSEKIMSTVDLLARKPHYDSG